MCRLFTDGGDLVVPAGSARCHWSSRPPLRPAGGGLSTRKQENLEGTSCLLFISPVITFISSNQLLPPLHLSISPPLHLSAFGCSGVMVMAAVHLQEFFFGCYETKLSTLALCQLLTHILSTGDPQLTEIAITEEAGPRDAKEGKVWSQKCPM